MFTTRRKKKDEKISVSRTESNSYAYTEECVCVLSVCVMLFGILIDVLGTYDSFERLCVPTTSLNQTVESLSIVALVDFDRMLVYHVDLVLLSIP